MISPYSRKFLPPSGGSLVLLSAFVLSGCSMMSAAGPSSRAVHRAAEKPVGSAEIAIVNVTEEVAQRLKGTVQTQLFSESFGDGQTSGTVIGRGDVLDIVIWEAPPGTLFGPAPGTIVPPGASARGTTLPEQMVDADGYIAVPFAGVIRAEGRTPQQISQNIVERLKGKAYMPQVSVRVLRNASANVTVVGDITNNTRVPLTTRGERLLDIVAAAGGVKQPIGKVTVQITRNNKVASMPLAAVIRDPRQNIRLQPDDVVTALFQPFSFTALGATGANQEIPFEGTGITLAQALGRVGGLQDLRANTRGAFLFRFEDAAALGTQPRQNFRPGPDGRVPVIYRINLNDPSTLFVAQNFQIRDKDILYVSNAPLADFQKFTAVITSTILPTASTAALVR